MNAPDQRPVPVPAPTPSSLMDRLDQKVFDGLYSRSLVYNTCWEDPAVDRQALQLGHDDSVLARL